MPRDIQDIIQQGVPADEFILRMRTKAKSRKPKRLGKSLKEIRGTLFASRNYRLVIREAALRQVAVIITYKKTTTGKTNDYEVRPYSYRYRRLKVGLRKMLFAQDTYNISAPDPKRPKSEDDKERPRIKGFSMRDIKKAILTDRKFKPKWKIEIK